VKILHSLSSTLIQHSLLSLRGRLSHKLSHAQTDPPVRTEFSLKALDDSRSVILIEQRTLLSVENEIQNRLVHGLDAGIGKQIATDAAETSTLKQLVPVLWIQTLVQRLRLLLLDAFLRRCSTCKRYRLRA